MHLLSRSGIGLEGSDRSDSALVIVSADHGGAGSTHGGLDPRSHFVPWIAAGFDADNAFLVDYDLTRVPDLRVRLEDTFATACAWLGLALEKPVDGRAVTEIFAAPPRAR